MNIDIIKILFPSFLTFTIGILITPFFTHYFYKYKMWKKSARTLADTSDEFNKVHNTSAEISTPRVGGIIIWSSVIICTLIIFLISLIFPNDLSAKLNFLDRGQTLIPFATLIFASLIGLTDDYFQISGTSNYAKDGLVYRKVNFGPCHNWSYDWFLVLLQAGYAFDSYSVSGRVYFRRTFYSIFCLRWL